MAATRSPRRTGGRVTRRGRALLDALDAAETKRLLATLLDARPELVAEAAGLAESQLGAVTAEDVAEDVAFALEELCVEDIWDRSGTQADGEYVEPTEAAWTVVEEAAAPFLEDLARRVELGRRAEATALCQGTLLGLYRVSQGEGEFLDGHAPDSLEEAAALAVATWKKDSLGKPAGGARAEEFAAMSRFVSDAQPEWRSFLTRALGRPQRLIRGRKQRP